MARFLFKQPKNLNFLHFSSYPPFYGFVVYKHADDAKRALRDMGNGYIKDCKVRTTVALPRYGGKLDRFLHLQFT